MSNFSLHCTTCNNGPESCTCAGVLCEHCDRPLKDIVAICPHCSLPQSQFRSLFMGDDAEDEYND